MKKITVQFWGDIICPMCPIGYVNLKEGIKLFNGKDNVELIYHSYRLRPGIAPHPVDEYLKGNHGPSTNVPSILKQVEEWGASAGLTYKMAKTQAGDTMDAHRVIHFAAAKGLQMEAVERLQKAHFAEEKNIFDRDVLVNAAGEIGLDRDAVARMLARNEFKVEVEADQEALYQSGVSGVPYFLINNEIVVRGVQDARIFLSGLNKAWEKVKAQPEGAEINGMSCGDHCAF